MRRLECLVERLSTTLQELVQQRNGGTGLCSQGQLCTFGTYGAEFIAQKWYNCETCGLVGELGCCEICARTCHKGHKVVLKGVSNYCYCDCGVGEGRAPCQCMGPLSGMKSTPLVRHGEGIIASMTRRFGGNLHDQKQVIVTVMDANTPGHPPKRVLDLNDPSTYYASQNNVPGAWFCLDFRDRRVIASSYCVQTYSEGDGHLQSWALEGSMDGTTWTLMDSAFEPRDAHINVYVTRIVTGAKGPYRYVRLLMTGLNHEGKWFLNCSGLELYGALFEPSK